MPNKKDTSWNKVAGWYGKYLQTDPATFHNKVIVPQLKALMQNLKLSKGAKVLDIACGEGIISQEVSNWGYQVDGFDLSQQLAKTAQGRLQGKGQVIVADAQNFAGQFQPASYDACISTLAIQNIPDFRKVASEAAKVLRKHGKFVVVLNHPCFRIPRQSDWGWDEGKKLQYRRLDIYRSELEIPIKAQPHKSQFGKGSNALTWSYHRPLAYYVDAFSKAGFQLSGLEEWYSHRQSEPGARAKAENRARQEFPLFMALTASLN